MHLQLYMFSLLAALCTGSSGAEKCPASRATSFTFSVASRRNLTGHWIVSVQAGRDDVKLAPLHKSSRGIAVDVIHTTVDCADSENTGLLATATLAATRIPPAGYEMVNALGYYKMHPVALTWDEAREKCAQEGAHVIVLNSEDEADVVRTFLARKPNIPNASHQDYTYIGVHDRVTEGQFVTLLGEPLASSGYARWRAGEPNGGKGENCVVVDREVKYADITCGWKVFVICEFSV